MNEEYLWDKTGEDAEIEKLENTLQAFRYRENTPPALPAKIIPFEVRRPRRFFRFAFAFAACAILMALGVSLWPGISKTAPVIEVGSAQINPDLPLNTAPEIAVPQPAVPNNSAGANPTIIKAGAPAFRKNIAPKYALERKIIKTPKLVHTIDQANATTAQNIELKDKAVRLTREEKFAYSQLMLALSITSSKLKIVKDTAEGLNKQDNAFSDH